MKNEIPPSCSKLIENILSRLDDIPCVQPDDLPGLDLYMDQVTTLMEEMLSPTRRNKDDKILTKTMINNYAKNHLLPPPVKKKYSRRHLLLLVFIYYFKGFLSLQDIRKLIDPLTSDIASGGTSFDMERLFKEVADLQHDEVPRIREDIDDILAKNTARFKQADSMFSDSDAALSKEDREYLQIFTIICSLAADVFIKKRIIEELIDSCL